MNLENSESWRGKKDEVATSIARVMEFSCCCVSHYDTSEEHQSSKKRLIVKPVS